MERNGTQGAAAPGEERHTPVPAQRGVQPIFPQPGGEPSADIHQLRNDPIASLETLRTEIGARLDSLDRKITSLILGVALFNGLLVLLTAPGCFDLAG